MKKLSILICALICAGCSPDTAQTQSINKSILSGEGVFIGALPDGRSVNRYDIDRGTGNPEHYVYVVSDNSSLSINYHESKSNKTIVVIDGKEFIEKNK